MSRVVSQDDVRLAVDVARREGWSDFRAPPERHPPRTLEEATAIARVQAAKRTPERAPERSGRAPRWAWVAMLLAAALVLGLCWYVSPGRTIAGLVGVALFCGIALMRRRRRAARPPGGRAGAWDPFRRTA